VIGRVGNAEATPNRAKVYVLPTGGNYYASIPMAEVRPSPMAIG